MGAANNSSSNTGQEFMDGLPHPGGNGFAVSRDLNPKLTDVISLKPLGRETRKHPSAQVRKLQSSIEQFGFVLPVVVDSKRRVVAGWGLVLAARKMGLLQVPAVTIDDLDEAKLRLLRLALNRLGEELSWDFDTLTLEFADILEINIDVDLQLSGFEMGEIDVAFARSAGDEEDDLQALEGIATPVTKLGDLWLLDNHRLLCGDALAPESYGRLLGEERAQMVFTDPPWNIAIAGNVSGLGAVKHEDFVMASGEMSATQFESFLRTSLGNSAAHSVDGSIHYVLHGLVEDARASRRNRDDLFRIKKPLRLVQTQWRDGIVISVATRARLRVQARRRGAHQQHRTRPPRPQSFEPLDLSEPERPQWNVKEQARVAPYAEACRPCRRRHP